MSNVIELLTTIVNEEFFERHPIFQEKLEAEKALYEPKSYKPKNTCYPVSDPKERKRNERRTARRNNRNPKTPFKHTRAALKAEPWHDKARKRAEEKKLIDEGLEDYRTTFLG